MNWVVRCTWVARQVKYTVCVGNTIQKIFTAAKNNCSIFIDKLDYFAIICVIDLKTNSCSMTHSPHRNCLVLL